MNQLKVTSDQNALYMETPGLTITSQLQLRYLNEGLTDREQLHIYTSYQQHRCPICFHRSICFLLSMPKDIKLPKKLLLLPPATKFGQGNIFRSVCQEFCSHLGAVHAGRYGQQAGGTHPTGMHTCS